MRVHRWRVHFIGLDRALRCGIATEKLGTTHSYSRLHYNTSVHHCIMRLDWANIPN